MRKVFGGLLSKLRPFARRKAKRRFKHLSPDEIYEIHYWWLGGVSQYSIAQKLNRSPATIFRALGRNDPLRTRCMDALRAMHERAGWPIMKQEVIRWMHRMARAEETLED